MDKLAPLGRLFFAIAIVAFGILHVLYGDFVTRVVPWWPEWIPLRPFWVGAIGVALIGAGAAILTDTRTVDVATGLGVGLLLSFLLLGLSLAAADAPFGGRWTVAGKALALAGGAFLVARAGWMSRGRPPDAWRERLWSLGPWFFGAFLLLCGIQHFIHVGFVMSLVPSWMPGAGFWTYFAGLALIAGGIGVTLPATAWAAGLLSGLMILLWVPMVHIPRAAAAATASSNETTAVFEALAMSGIAFLIAATASTRGTVPLRNDA